MLTKAGDSCLNGSLENACASVFQPCQAGTIPLWTHTFLSFTFQYCDIRCLFFFLFMLSIVLQGEVFEPPPEEEKQPEIKQEPTVPVPTASAIIPTTTPPIQEEVNKPSPTPSPKPQPPKQQPKPQERKGPQMMHKGVGQFLQMNQNKLQEERDREHREQRSRNIGDGGIPGFGGVADQDNRFRERSVERQPSNDNNWVQGPEQDVRIYFLSL